MGNDEKNIGNIHFYNASKKRKFKKNVIGSGIIDYQFINYFSTQIDIITCIHPNELKPTVYLLFVCRRFYGIVFDSLREHNYWPTPMGYDEKFRRHIISIQVITCSF